MSHWYCPSCKQEGRGFEYSIVEHHVLVFRCTNDDHLLTAIPDGVKVDGECPECHEIVYSDFGTQQEGMTMHYVMKHRDKARELGVLRDYDPDRS